MCGGWVLRVLGDLVGEACLRRSFPFSAKQGDVLGGGLRVLGGLVEGWCLGDVYTAHAVKTC